MSESSALIAKLRGIAAAGARAPAEAGDADGWLRQGLARGQLHEIYAADEEDAGAAAGFVAAVTLAARATPLVWLRPQEAEKRAGRLHATGLVEMGMAADDLAMVVIAPDPGALLRAAADVARCAGVATLVMESWGPMPALDLTATRRLVLAAEASGVAVMSLRCRAEPVASAAATRWRVSACPSAALDADAPGLPAFEVELLRRRGGPAGARWRVEWNRETRCFDPFDVQAANAAPLAGAGVPLAARRSA